jgi:hypothetical protein
MPGVELPDDDGGGFKELRPVTAKNAIVKAGIVKSASHANLILFVLAVLLVAGIVYFMRIAVPPAPPELGQDEPRWGETIPGNRTL